MLPLPVKLEELSPAWLTAAMGLRYPGVQVTRATQTEVLHGTATKARITVEYNMPGIVLGCP